MKNTLLYTGLIVVLLSTSCREEDPLSDELRNGTNQYINSWVFENMNTYYYWTDDLPDKDINGANPDDYFYSILSNEDRFSWIQPNFQELINSLQGINLEAGYELILYNDPDNASGVVGQIAYVKKDSPAEAARIRRGDKITKINGSTLNLDNYSRLLSNLGQTHTLTIERYNFGDEAFEELGDFELNTVQLAENPNYLDTIYTINGKKIGYYIYNHFTVGISSTGDSLQYNNEMDDVFQNFKANAIDHLILDLRYNSGGAERATINLASLIGADITDQDIFVRRDYNDILMNAFQEEYGADWVNRKFTNKATNIGNILQSPQLTVLTSARTASASELLINGLNPFIEILIVGDTTVGKNVGSTSIYERDNPENTWGMQPIIAKSFNSLDQSNYDMGFYPDIARKDNSLIKRQLGDINEALLNEALTALTGSPAARESHEVKRLPAKDIGGSIELKRNFGIYNIETK